MLVIRLNRVGRRNKAQFRIVVQEHTTAPSGHHIAIVGSYDPHTKAIILKADEIKKYMANGAQPSDTVYNLLVREGVITTPKRSVKMPDEVNAEGKEGALGHKVNEDEEGAEEPQSVVTDVSSEKKEEEKKVVEAKKETPAEDKEEEKKPVSAEAPVDKKEKAVPVEKKAEDKKEVVSPKKEEKADKKESK